MIFITTVQLRYIELAMRAILACIAVLILIAALVLGRESSSIMIALVASAGAAGVIVAAGQTGVTGGAREDAKSSAMFGRLREDKRALERVRQFLNAAGHGFGNVVEPLLARSTADDEAILEQLRAAWQEHHGPTPRETEASRAARARKRVVEAIDYFGPERAKARADTAYRYLDVGAAEGDITGAVVAALRLAPGQATAVDILPPAAAPAGFDAVQIDGETLPFPDASIDLFTMFMSAHHFEKVDAMFGEVARVAKPGARLIMREHGRADPSAALYYDVIHAYYAVVQAAETTPASFAAAYARGTYAHYRTPAEWQRIAAAAGFTRVAHTAPKPDSFDTVRALYVYGAAACAPAAAAADPDGWRQQPPRRRQWPKTPQ